MGNHAQALIQWATVGEAAQAFEACAGLDPEGVATPESVASMGASFTLITPNGKITYTLSESYGECWIHGAAGRGHGMTEAGLDMIEAQARAATCKSVAFQTVRRGLIKKATAKGYRIRERIGQGYILEKSIT